MSKEFYKEKERTENLCEWKKDLHAALNGMISISGLLKGMATTITLMQRRVETIALPLQLSLEIVEKRLGDEVDG